VPRRRLLGGCSRLEKSVKTRVMLSRIPTGSVEMIKLLRMLFDRQLPSAYVPIVATITLLVNIVAFITIVWHIGQQRERWVIEDDRASPRFSIRISREVREERFRFGQLLFVNTLSYDHMTLVRIEAIAPTDLMFTEITNLPRWTLRGELRRVLEIQDTIIQPKGTFSMMIVFRTDRTPGSDQGQDIEFAAEAIDLSSGRTVRRSVRLAIPDDAAR
jgi:hypothetical protein